MRCDTLDSGEALNQLYEFQLNSQKWPGLAKLTEESGEVLQIVGKLIANGGQDQHWDGTNLRDQIQEELGQLLAAITFVCEHCNLDKEVVERNFETKTALYEKWRKEGT